MTLHLVINNSGPEDIERGDHSPSAEFVRAAILAAQNSKHKVKSKIVTDLCAVLNCAPSELEFLFEQGRSSLAPNIDKVQIPDFRETMESASVRLPEAAE